MAHISIPARVIDSCKFASYVAGGISTVCTILGYSLLNVFPNSTLCIRILAMAVAFVVLSVIMYIYVCKDSVTLKVGNNNVTICLGNIFEAKGYKVIACDTKFSTQADDTVISKNSLHGQFLLQYADIPEVQKLVNNASDGSGVFRTGKIIMYHNDKDDETYLLLAFTELNERNEAHTNMPEFVRTLMRMWREINSVYNGHDIALPLLGTGITRFDDGPKDKRELLACMLYALYFSGVTFSSRIQIVMKDGDIPLYEYKNILQIVSK